MSVSCHFRHTLGWLAFASLVILTLAACGRPTQPEGSGGKLTIAFRTEPTTYDLLVASRPAELRATYLTQSTLVRVNRRSQQLEPRLATSWTVSTDDLTWTLNLRRGALFSDGVPFTSADVVFTFKALYDSRLSSQMTSDFLIGGKPLTVRAVDDYTVTITFPSIYGPNIRILDGLPILPQHKLEDALDAGSLRQAWTRTTPASEVVGLGPFQLAENVPGQAIKFTRNPHYWATDDHGHALPYLDEVDVEIVPSQDAEILRLESGDLDVPSDFVRPEDIAAMRDLASKGRVSLLQAGVGLDPSALWFDLAAQSKPAKGRPWLQREELRQAISLAVDRQAIVDSVYLGLGVPIAGPVTPGFGDWYSGSAPVPTRDLPRAKKLLASIGLVDRRGDGRLEDSTGQLVHFTLLTQKGKTERERTASLLASQLKTLGLDIDVVPLDFQALVGHLTADDYDAIYFGPEVGSTDPAEDLQFWLSSGSFHFWNLHEDKGPATPWEAQIDDLMRREAASPDQADRHRMFASAQSILAEHVPAVYLAAPRVTVAVNSRVHGVQASVFQPPVLWNIDVLSVSPRPSGQ